MFNNLPSEAYELVGAIDPAVNTTERFSPVVDMRKYHDVMGIFTYGTMAGTTTARVVTCDSAGGNAAALKTAAVTTSTDSDEQIAIIVKNSDLAGGGANADRYVKFGIAASSTGGPASAVIVGRPKSRPAAKPASLVQVVTAKDS